MRTDRTATKTQIVKHVKRLLPDFKAIERDTQKRAIPPLRDIAKMLASHLPVEGDEFGQKVSAIEAELKRKTRKDKAYLLALQTAFIFCHKVPRQEREAVFQELFVNLWEKRITDNGIAYAVALHDWSDWWRAYKIRSHYSLDSVVNEESGASFGDLLVGVCDFEAQIQGKINGDRLLEALPERVRGIVQKRLDGHATTKLEQSLLRRFVDSRPTVLAQYSN
jgi:hypothetical protein